MGWTTELASVGKFLWISRACARKITDLTNSDGIKIINYSCKILQFRQHFLGKPVTFNNFSKKITSYNANFILRKTLSNIKLAMKISKQKS